MTARDTKKRQHLWAARSGLSTNTRSRWFVPYACACACALIAALSALHRELPGPALLIALSVLLILAEQRGRLFGDETSISGSVIVAMSAVVAFGTTGAVGGPLLCAAMAGLYWPHIRERNFAKVAINAFSMGSAALTAALIYDALLSAGDRSAFSMLVTAIPAVLGFWIVNSTVLAVAVVLMRGDSFPSTIRLLLHSETEMLAFAWGGAACGYIMINESEALGFVAVAALLAAVDVFVIGRRNRSNSVLVRAQIAEVAGRLMVSSTAVAAIGAVFFLEPHPDFLIALPLVVGAGVAGACGGRSFAQRISVALLVSLVAVGVFQGEVLLAGSGLVGLAAGVGLCVREHGIARRALAIGLGGVPALAAAGVAAALPIDASDGFVSLLGIAVGAALAAVVARAVVAGVAIAPGAGFAGVLIAVGEVVADAWVVAAGSAAVVIAWYSVAGGLAFAAAVAVAALLLERRRAARTTPTFPRELSDEEALDLVTAAVCDRPNAPTALP